MKKIIVVLSIILSSVLANSQPVTGGYYTNNSMSPFHGTWMWVSGMDTVKIYLDTKKVYMDIAGGYYRDMLVGWHIYKRGNTIIESSLDNINVVSGNTIIGSNSTDAQNTVTASIEDISKKTDALATLTINTSHTQITWRMTEHQGLRVHGSPQNVPPPGLTLPRNMVLIRQ